jgi:hypothetical protein
VKKSFNIQELLHRKSKCHETKLMHPSSSSRGFPKSPRTRSEASWFGVSHKYKQNKTKQNKLPSFIDRWVRSWTSRVGNKASQTRWLCQYIRCCTRVFLFFFLGEILLNLDLKNLILRIYHEKKWPEFSRFSRKIKSKWPDF